MDRDRPLDRRPVAGDSPRQSAAGGVRPEAPARALARVPVGAPLAPVQPLLAPDHHRPSPHPRRPVRDLRVESSEHAGHHGGLLPLPAVQVGGEGGAVSDSLPRLGDGRRALHPAGAGISVFFFPEGTRSRTGQLGPFKNGAFKLALETGTSIVPVVITGTRGLLKRGSWLFNPTADVRIAVLPPIQPSTDHADPDRLRDHVRDLIARTLQQRAASASL
ncbi:MAG: 1-acyl-sn-glycerol-3-phosphate acyltransferase [Candidatus Omnitrophica bacterium]|nr:1-acyl-sn-glycerol-3-phosphate acyltransferase [Candidatus Omnitrophota bacterium]